MKTAAKTINVEVIPEELRTRRQWVVWRAESRNGKMTKVPIDPSITVPHGWESVPASTTDPQTWSLFHVAWQRFTDHADVDGIGFVFTTDDSYVGIDLDHCRDPQTGTIELWADEIVRSLSSYTESSPSGTGLHIIVKGDLPQGPRRKGAIEMYDRARYFTMTGQHVDGTLTTIEERTAELTAFHARIFETSATSSGASPSYQRPRPTVEDADLLARARAAANGMKFERLWSGEYHDYPSQSEADVALCSLLAFWTGPDTVALDRLFRQSGLYREKWDERHFGDGRTYGQATIDKALHGTREYYTWHQSQTAGDTEDAGEQEPNNNDDHDQQNSEAPTLKDAMVEFRDILTWQLPERKTHVVWIREGGIIMAFGPRGVGKTMLQLALAAALTTGTDFLRWKVSAPVGVLFVDGEMPLDELRTRITALSPEPPKAPLYILTSEIVYQKLERDLVLTSIAMQEAVTEILDAHPEIRVVILDNISTLFSGIDEDKKRDWEPIQSWLIRLRHRGLAVVLVHHAGKMGQQRGTSGREDALDTVIELGRPANYDAQEGCHFELKFTKSRSVKGEEVTPLDVRLVESGKGLTWDWKALEKSKEEQVKDLLQDGVESSSDLAEALGITRSYAWKLKRRVEKQLKEASP